MMKLLLVNTGECRRDDRAKHGKLCSSMRIAVETTGNRHDYDGGYLVEIIDANGTKHWVDPWFLSDPAS